MSAFVLPTLSNIRMLKLNANHLEVYECCNHAILVCKTYGRRNFANRVYYMKVAVLLTKLKHTFCKLDIYVR